MIRRHCSFSLILVLALLTGRCAAHRFADGPSDAGPILGDLTTVPEPYATGGPSQQDVDHLTQLLTEARNALYAGNNDQAEQRFEAALTRISDLELRYGDLPQGYDDFQDIVDAVLDEYRAFMRATAPYERPPIQPLLAAEPAAQGNVQDPAPSAGTAPMGQLPPVPYVRNSYVDTYIKYFTGRGRKHFRIYLERAGRYQSLITRVLREEGLPENMFYLAMIESGLNPSVRSRARAVGTWQFISATARVYGLRVDSYVDERRDVEKSTRAASHFLKNLYREYGDWYLAISGYNGNKRHVTNAIKKYKTRDWWKLKNGLRRETRGYVPKYIAAALIAENPEKYGFHDIQLQTPIPYETATIQDCVDLDVLARCAGVTGEIMRILNPELLRGYTPPTGEPYTLKIPEGTARVFQIQLAALPDKFKVPKVAHTVRRGQTLSGIARRYGLSTRDILAVNKLRNPNRLAVGQTLIIPAPPKYNYAAASSGSTRRTSGAVTRLNPPSDAQKVIYTVRRGDSLDRISKKFGVTVNQLRGWNGIRRGAYIYPKQTVTLYIPTTTPRTPRQFAAVTPSNRTHVVRSGDTLWDIARLYNVSLSALMQTNGKNRRSRIHPGDRITIPLAE